MRKFFAVAMGSAVALLGFASAANASATVDLVWIDASVTGTNGVAICLRPAKRNCQVIGSTLSVPNTVFDVDNITLAVILTAGDQGSNGGSVSVDYSAVVPQLSVLGYKSLPSAVAPLYLPLALGDAIDTGTVIDGLNAGASVQAGAGLGLPTGVTAYLGTVQFHQDTIVNGTFVFDVNTDGALDGLGDIFGNDITDTSTYNEATLVNVPEPGALSLLVMGVGGMLLAGRGRRS
jgi:hypothetical protein